MDTAGQAAGGPAGPAVSAQDEAPHGVSVCGQGVWPRRAGQSVGQESDGRWPRYVIAV